MFEQHADQFSILTSISNQSKTKNMNYRRYVFKDKGYHFLNIFKQ